MDDIRLALMRSVANSDPLPTIILHEVVDVILPFIWVMCNVSLSTGCLVSSTKFLEESHCDACSEEVWRWSRRTTKLPTYFQLDFRVQAHWMIGCRTDGETAQWRGFDAQDPVWDSYGQSDVQFQTMPCALLYMCSSQVASTTATLSCMASPHRSLVGWTQYCTLLLDWSPVFAKISISPRHCMTHYIGCQCLNAFSSINQSINQSI